MSTYTNNLNLFKYDTITDAKRAFSIDDALNNNWDVIDALCGTGQDIHDCDSPTITLLKTKSIYRYTPSATTTFSFVTTNLSLTSGIAYTFELIIPMSTVRTLSFTNVTWGKIIGTPDMTNTGTYFFAFRTIDAGSTWKGSLQDVWS